MEDKTDYQYLYKIKRVITLVYFNVKEYCVQGGKLRTSRVCKQQQQSSRVLSSGIYRHVVCWKSTVGLSLDLFFDSEDGAGIFLKNVGWYSTDYIVLYSRTQNSS
jgi:hypothetical protein